MHLALTNHSRQVRYEAEKLKDDFLSGNLKDSIEYRKQEKGITIDKKSSKDLDDGIKIIKRKDGYSIYISIADVSEIVKKGTILDIDAYNRSTSVYTATNTFHMFPSELSTDICSLNNKTSRYAITTKIDINNDFNVINVKKYESEFYNEKRFNYEDFEEHFKNPDLKYHSELNMYLEVVNGLYKKRISRGGVKDYKEKVAIKIGKEENSKSIASFIIQELMILNNIESAKYNYKEKIESIYRLNMPENKGFFIPNKQIQRAFYNFKNGFHYGLGENFYTHSTSPIRRYADLIEQRQFKSHFRGIEPEYNINEIRKSIININTNIEKILNEEKKYNGDIFEKRILRFIKKLSINNYKDIDSVSSGHFSSIIRLMTLKPDLVENNYIIAEILYRLDNNLLSNTDISRIKSCENKTKGIRFIFEKIQEKEELQKQKEVELLY